MIRKAGWVLPALLLAAGPALGGTVTLGFNQHSTQNLFQTSFGVKDQISAFSLGLEQDLSALSVLANLSYSAFKETSGLSFLSADFGLDYLLPAGEKSAFYFAAAGMGTFYRQTYSAFSVLGGNLVGAFKSYLSPSSILKLQWQGTYAAFKDPLFDFVSQIASLSLDKYFPSRTTLKADGEWGYKYFLHPFVTEAPEPVPAPEPSFVLMAGSGPGPGSGNGSGSGTGSGSGWGNRDYYSDNGFIPRYNSAGGGAGIGHLAASLLLAQGLGDSVGLSALATRQWVVTGENPFTAIEEFYLVQNPTSDAFSWDGTQLTGRITVLLPWSIEVKAGYTYSDKSYPGVELLDLAGLPTGVTRADVRKLVEVRLQKTFRHLSVFAAYSHIDNASNAPLFAWKGHYFMGGFQWSLPTGNRGGTS